MTKLTHLGKKGEARMVDVSAKPATARTAIAKGQVSMSKAALDALKKGNSKKGDVLGVARLAGVMAAKRTSELIPLCHALPLTEIKVGFETSAGGVTITARAKTVAQTGVEMEALTAVSVAALTLYDMLKAVDRAMTISDIRLVKKSGGRSGHYEAP
jgi:cyclic pyranopterin phosphate synthase